MKKICIPSKVTFEERLINKEKIKTYFESSGKVPSIKEQMVLRAYEITGTTKVVYDNEDITLLYSTDETGTFLSCFNKRQEALQIELPLETIHLEGNYTAYCVLTAEPIYILQGVLSLQVPDSGILLVKIIPEV